MNRRIVAGVALIALSLGACGGSKREEILVFAAASLTESFSKIGPAFERAHPGVRVRFNWGPSDGLATGIVNGGAADVFASASWKWMDTIASDPGVLDSATFARNRLTVIVPKDNPAGIAAFDDLVNAGVKLVLAAAAVPAGTYARQALANAGLGAERNVVSNEEDVKGVVQKVVLGEADAGIVYVTDVTEAVKPRVRVVPIPEAVNVLASYPIAVVKTSAHLATARLFVAYVRRQGQAVLRDVGFLSP